MTRKAPHEYVLPPWSPGIWKAKEGSHYRWYIEADARFVVPAGTVRNELIKLVANNLTRENAMIMAQAPRLYELVVAMRPFVAEAAMLGLIEGDEERRIEVAKLLTKIDETCKQANGE